MALHLHMADIMLADLRRAVDEDVSRLTAQLPLSRPQAFHH
jgi:hypothetical protein